MKKAFLLRRTVIALSLTALALGAQAQADAKKTS